MKLVGSVLKHGWLLIARNIFTGHVRARAARGEFTIPRIYLKEENCLTTNLQPLPTIPPHRHRIGVCQAMDNHLHHYDHPQLGNKGVGSRARTCFGSACLFLKGQFTSSGEKITGRRLLAVTIALMISALFGELDRQLLVTAIPKIASEFRSMDKAAWYQASHDLGRLAFLPIFGRVYTLFPLKITFCVNVLISIIGAYLVKGFTFAPGTQADHPIQALLSAQRRRPPRP